MGIHDRDYARPNSGQKPQGFSLRRSIGPGGPWRITITTWIIIICAVVFAFDAFAGPKWQVETTAGEVYGGPFWTENRPPTLAERKTFVTARDQTQQLPDGFLGHPKFRADANGNIARAPDGTPQQIGLERFLQMPPLKSIGHFSTGKGFTELQVWRLVLFQFLHADLNHLVLNMLGLFFFGPLVERYLGGGRRYLAFYLMCGICGALFYLLLNLLGAGFGLKLPGVLVGDTYTPLIGASAGCFGVLIAAAYIAGDEEMLFFGIIPMKVRTGAYIMLALAAANLLWGGQNAGGDAAHIGGAIAGWFFIRRPYLLREFFDFFGPGRTKLRRENAAGANSRGRIAGGMTGTIGRAAPSARPRSSGPTLNEQRRIDELLDKVKDKGLASLTDDEREFLRRFRDA
ncbi:MAG: rhomboid family intramembrane serine protease [Phycisphaerales bacterium]